jgi:lipopolysaccharide transport system ATP-binding protein
LLIDEVLAVGDAAFQRKCLGKMGDVAKEGRTVFFVSHNMTAVQSLCTDAIWLEQGRLAKRGVVSLVINSYLQATVSSRAEQVWPDLETAPGNGSVRLHSVRVLPQRAMSSDQLTIVDPFAIEIQYWNLKPDTRLNLSLTVYNQEGVCVFASTTEHEAKWHGRPFPTGLFRSVCQVPGDLLNDGMHRVTLLVVQDSAFVLYCYEDVLIFELHDSPDRRGSWYGKWPGAMRVNLKWTTQHVCGSKEGTAGASVVDLDPRCKLEDV